MPHLPARPTDATLSVTKAARVLGVHPNTVRAWSDQGRLRYYRINPRGDRRYRSGDLERFMQSALGTPTLPPRPIRVHPTPPGDEGPDARDGRTGGRTGGGTTAIDTEADAPPAGRAEGGADGPALPRSAARISLDRAGSRDGFAVVAAIAAAVAAGGDLDGTLARAARLLRDAGDHRLVAVWEARGERLIARATASARPTRIVESVAESSAMRGAIATLGPVLRDGSAAIDWAPVLPDIVAEAAVPIRRDGDPPWGALLVAADRPGTLAAGDLRLMEVVAAEIAMAVRSAALLAEAAHQLHRADALRRVATDVTSTLDLDRALAGLVDHAMVLFEADRGAIFLGRPSGEIRVGVSRGLSPTYLAAVRTFPSPSLPALAVERRAPMFSVGYRDDPHGVAVRAAVVQEGYDTICTAPLFDGDELLGLLNVYHDRPHRWADEELETMAAFATQAGVAIRTAQHYAQMATWAAQLQSIQQLGTRLNRLTSVRAIGAAIATGLRELIDYHNVRVYRLEGSDLIPVAMLGQVGEYEDETFEQLRGRLGRGITGWVAEHGIAQNLPDAARDPRAETIPGTDAGLDESMLLAPMIFEDRVIGVLVLSKLGLSQFTDDDLRLLVIYASFAAQAMANADATELLRTQSSALERQVRSQRELLEITESILGTLEPHAVLDQIADRLGALVRYDNLSIELWDATARRLSPLTAKGVHAAEFMEPWEAGEEGIATWVIDHNEPQLIPDELADPRVRQFERTGPLEGSLVVVPLRGRDGAQGVLTLERLGAQDRFSVEEFELVQLFAAHVSIALQNAEVHSAVEVRARSDGLTGALNHATFQDRLARAVAAHEPFSLIMLDLDDFKSVNDRLGHQAGDRFLREVAAAITSGSREGDQVFRYGGDEFVLLLPATGLDGARAVAERIGRALHEVGAEGSEWHRDGVLVSGSVGLATFPADGGTAEEMLLAADRACFVAKRGGRDRIAIAAEGRALAAEFPLQVPTPFDPPTPPEARADASVGW